VFASREVQGTYQPCLFIYLLIFMNLLIIAAQGVKQNGTIRRPNVGNRTIPPAGAIVAVCRLFNSLSPPVSYSTQSRRAAWPLSS
jgi:hypothetical protein